MAKPPALLKAPADAPRQMKQGWQNLIENIVWLRGQMAPQTTAPAATGAASSSALSQRVASLEAKRQIDSFTAMWDGAPPKPDRLFHVERSGTIVGITLMGIGSGTATVDVLRAPLADYPPDAADSIVPTGMMPAIATGMTYHDETLNGWSVAVTKGDVLALRLVSSTFSALVAQLAFST